MISVCYLSPILRVLGMLNDENKVRVRQGSKFRFVSLANVSNFSDTYTQHIQSTVCISANRLIKLVVIYEQNVSNYFIFTSM